jgi:hypothetical protein
MMWLDQFRGTWTADGQEYRVGRRRDGWLEAYNFTQKEDASLGWVLSHAKRIKPPAGPLGPLPACLSQMLMEIWLSPEQCQQLRGAGNVGRGINQIYEAVESAMETCDPANRREKLMATWSIYPPEVIPADDEILLDQLQSDFRHETEPTART